MNCRIQKKINYLSELKNKISLWSDKTEEELAYLIKEFEKMTRAEISSYFFPYFKDNSFAEILFEIANKYKENKRIHIYIISSLGNMVNRYNLKESKEIYKHFKKYRLEKGVSAYVAIHLPHFKNFQKEENKWDYFMKIAKMTPKKIAEINFLVILNEYIEEVPDEYKQEIIDFLQGKYQMANNEGGKKYYQDMINRINFNF